MWILWIILVISAMWIGKWLIDLFFILLRNRQLQRREAERQTWNRRNLRKK